MTYADTVLADTPLAYFPLTESGEAIGATYADATGHGYDVHVQTGRLTHGPGPLPCTTAPVFPDFSVAPYDNADALLGSLTAGLPVDGQPYSLEGWLRPQVTGYAMQWVAYGPAGGITFIGGDIDIEPADVDHLHLSNYAASNLARNSYPIDAGDGRWHYIVITDDAGGTVVFYVDGTAVQTFAVGSNNGLIFDAGNVLSIGDAGGHYGTLSPADDPYGGGIAQVAIYGHVLTAGRVAAHYAAALASVCPPDWVRLSHVSGQGYWQSSGDVIEEWAGGARRLSLPFATLGAAPDLLMGKDPATDLPAFCPAPVVPPPIALPPVPPAATPDICVQVRCGVAINCTQHLTSLYATWANWINGALSLIVGAITAAALALLLDPLMIELDIALWAFLRPVLVTLSSTVISAGMGPMTGDRQMTLTHALFCQLACAGDVCTLDAATMIAWSNALTAGGWSGFDNLESTVLNQLILHTPMTDWQSAAATAGQSGSCDAWTCP